MVKVLLLLILASCASSTPDEANLLDLTALKAKHETYLELSKQHQGAGGFVDDTDCDSLLFSSLYSYAGGEIEVTVAQGEPGRWYRTPAHDCYPDRSGSDISRDMLLGLLFHALKYKDSSISHDLIGYGEQNGWVMGDGSHTRTWLNPGFRKTIALLDKKLSNDSSNNRYLRFPDVWGSRLTGYQAHLIVLHLTLRDMISGKIDEAGDRVVSAQYQRSPGNALFSFLYHKYHGGDQTGTLRILMDEALFPAGKLPTTNERCEPYLWQRDEPYAPCPEEEKEHAGVDFLFVSRLIIDQFK